MPRDPVDMGLVVFAILAGLVLVVGLLNPSGPIHFCLIGACP
jgi:hypothetical protein